MHKSVTECMDEVQTSIKTCKDNNIKKMYNALLIYGVDWLFEEGFVKYINKSWLYSIEEYDESIDIVYICHIILSEMISNNMTEYHIDIIIKMYRIIDIFDLVNISREI